MGNMKKADFFTNAFGSLLNLDTPFPWQTELFKRLTENRIPAQCNIPTGLGKTSIIHAWALALLWQVSEKKCHFFLEDWCMSSTGEQS